MAEIKINFGNIGVNESFKWKSNEFKKVNSRNAKVIGKNQIYMFNIHDIVIKELVEKKEDDMEDIYQFYINQSLSQPKPYVSDDDDQGKDDFFGIIT